MPRLGALVLIASSLASGAIVHAQGQVAAWQTILGSTTLSESDSSRSEILPLPIEINPLGLRELSLCRDGRFFLKLEHAGNVIGMDGATSGQLAGHWVIVRAGVTAANLELSPNTMGSSAVLLAAELQRFTISQRGKSIYVNGVQWFIRPSRAC